MAKAFEAAGYDASYGRVTVSNRPDLCQYQCNGALAAAKAYKCAPIAIANAVVQQLDAADFSMCDAVMPGFINLKLSDSFLQNYLEAMRTAPDFGVEKIGSGKTITDQTPVGGAIIPVGAQVVLYCGEVKPDDLCTVPNVMGMTAAQANKALTNAGLIMKVTGANNKGAVYAINQSVAAEKQVKAGTVVTVQFGDTSLLD